MRTRSGKYKCATEIQAAEAVQPLLLVEKQKVEKNKMRKEKRDALRIQIANESSFIPITLSAAAEQTLNKHDCFMERSKAEAIILGLAEFNDKAIERKESASDAVTYRCKVDTCPYAISVRAHKDQRTCSHIWRVTKKIDHQCDMVPRNGMNTNYSVGQLAAALANSSTTAFTGKTAKEKLAEYAIGDLSAVNVHRAIREATAKRSENLNEQTSRLMQYAKVINDSEVGAMQVHMKGGKLYGFTFSPRAEHIMAHRGYLPRCVFSDGAHLVRLPIIGTIFTTITMDCGRKLRPLSVSYILDNESEGSWTTHYETFKENLPENYGPLLDVGDQDKGEIAARKKIMPESSSFFCSLHRKKNIAKRSSSAGGVHQYDLALSATSMTRLDAQLERFEPNLKNYIEKIPRECQFPAAAVHHGLPYIAEHTSNPVESWNNCMQVHHVRNCPPFEAAMNLVSYCVKKFHKDKDEAAACLHECPRNIMKIVDETESHKRALNNYIVETNGSDGVYLVANKRTPNSKNLVNLRADHGQRCSCEREKIYDGLPACEHILACALRDTTGERSIQALVPGRYRTRTWREGYNCVEHDKIIAPPTQDLMAEEAEKIELPRELKRPRGRPSATSLGVRKKSWFETGRHKKQKQVENAKTPTESDNDTD